MKSQKRMFIHHLLGLFVISFSVIESCDFPFTARPELTSKSSAQIYTPDCSQCHNYPLTDQHHLLHLTYEDGNRLLNGPITCADCHNTSVPSHSVMVLDTLFEEPGTGMRYYASDPYNPDMERTWKIIQYDTLMQDHPVLANRVTGSPPKVREWVTGIAHMNGNIDVVFDAKISDTVRFHGEKAYFNPIRETCSAIACHGGNFPYRSAAPSKGLSYLGGTKPDSL